jgi:hypothetical protein
MSDIASGITPPADGGDDDEREQPELAGGTEVPEELTDEPVVSAPTGPPDADQPVPDQE